MQAILAAVKTHGKRVRVCVTESRPTGQGLRTYERLRAEGIPCTVVLDTAVAYVIDRIDLCLVGAEAVAESGGIFNAIGSYQLSIIAKAAKKPVFALAERYAHELTRSFKFLRLFPLSQYDVPHAARCIPLPAVDEDAGVPEDGRMTPAMEARNPLIDYTLPGTCPMLTQNSLRSLWAMSVFSRRPASRTRFWLCMAATSELVVYMRLGTTSAARAR